MNNRNCILKLRALLSTVKKKVELIAEGKREIFIFGAGNTAKLHAKCFDAEGIQPVGFLDNDPKKQGTPFLKGGGYWRHLLCKGVMIYSF